MDDAPPLPERRFATILADPPWPYGNANKPGAVFGNRRLVADGSRLERRVNEWTYEPMPLDAIAALGVESIAEPNAHLYLWTTNSFMCQAHDVARAWGFQPKTIITWTKVRRDGCIPSMKMGYYFRGATEHIVFAVRGTMRLQTRKGWPTALLTPRISKHSRKPDESYAMIEACSPAPRVELFARRERPGWTAWGDQAA